jgi:hypothetical protein
MGERNAVVKENGQYSVVLSKREDFVKYAVRAQKPDKYSVVAEVGRGAEGAIVEAVVGESAVYKFEVPKELNFNGAEYIPVMLGTIDLSGKTTLKLRLWRGVFKFRGLEFYADAELIPFDISDADMIQSSLRSVADGGYTVTADNAVKSGASGYYMLLGGSAGAANFEYEASVARFDGTGEGGIVFRAKNYSYHADQPIQGFQGYFLQIRERVGTLYRYYYGQTALKSASLADENNDPIFAKEKFVRVRVRCVDNRITVWIGGEQIFDVFDDAAFMDGRVGLYSRNASFLYKDLTYKDI